MHILLAPDSFKESLSAKQVAEALKKGFQEALPDATFDLLPIGDGGEGTMDTLAGILNLTKKTYSGNRTIWTACFNVLLSKR